LRCAGSHSVLLLLLLGPDLRSNPPLSRRGESVDGVGGWRGSNVRTTKMTWTSRSTARTIFMNPTYLEPRRRAAALPKGIPRLGVGRVRSSCHRTGPPHQCGPKSQRLALPSTAIQATKGLRLVCHHRSLLLLLLLPSLPFLSLAHLSVIISSFREGGGFQRSGRRPDRKG
jgi:hypothetical protein